MAHHKSAKKRNEQNNRRRAANRKVKKYLRGQVKTARATIAAGSAKPNEGDVQAAVSALSNAVRLGVLHKRTAARRISRLMSQAKA